MTVAEVGAYMLLLCHSWLEGSIPDDPLAAAKLCRIPPSQMKKAWPSIRPCWKPSEDGRLINPRQERERENQIQYREQQARAGRISGEVRKRTAFERRSHGDDTHNEVVDSECDSSLNSNANENNSRSVPQTSTPSQLNHTDRAIINERRSRFVRTSTPTKTKSASASSTASTYGVPQASEKDSTVLVDNSDLPPALIPLKESLRPHAQAIGKEPDDELVRKIAEAAQGQPLSAAAWIGKTWLRRFSERAVHRQPTPESLAYWLTAIREEAAKGWQS